jgi:hypothetical protein
VDSLPHKGIDLVAIVRGKVDELNVKADLEFVIAYNTSRTDLVAVWETKTQCYSRSGDRRNVALYKDTLGGQIQDSAIAAMRCRFAAST